jgi:hypothetical protein
MACLKNLTISRRTVDMLLAEAETRSSHQFIFFTPQEMNLKAKSTITIHK